METLRIDMRQALTLGRLLFAIDTALSRFRIVKSHGLLWPRLLLNTFVRLNLLVKNQILAITPHLPTCDTLSLPRASLTVAP
jgi:hypothetical protein